MSTLLTLCSVGSWPRVSSHHEPTAKHNEHQMAARHRHIPDPSSRHLLALARAVVCPPRSLSMKTSHQRLKPQQKQASNEPLRRRQVVCSRRHRRHLRETQRCRPRDVARQHQQVNQALFRGQKRRFLRGQERGTAYRRPGSDRPRLFGHVNPPRPHLAYQHDCPHRPHPFPPATEI